MPRTFTAERAAHARAFAEAPGRQVGRPRAHCADGQRVAIFYTKVDRLMRPLLAADQPPTPPTLRKALHTIDAHVMQYIDAARLPLKAA